ncbi:MAG: hypothetical protein AAFZ52_05115 [Bacteroidota bacterium]
MYRILLSFVLPLSVLLTGCGDGLEPIEETDALGFRNEFRIDPETGLKQGGLRQYDPQGRLLSEEFYVNGQLHGPRTIYHSNGQEDVTENYDMGEFAGDYRHYDSLGTLRLEGQYIDGAMNKAWTNYYANGRIRSAVTFVDNAENGPFREWYDNGSPRMSGNYLDGDNIEGILHRYDSVTGELNRILECDFGRCHTVWTPDSTQAPSPGVDMTPPAR